MPVLLGRAFAFLRNTLSVALLVCCAWSAHGQLDPATASAPSAAGASAATARPCDVLASATPCVEAISTTRALYSGYTGPLYRVTRLLDGAEKDIGLLPDGYADAAMQDTFCGRATCAIDKLYDQSLNHNDLVPSPRGGASAGVYLRGYDLPAEANALPISIAGHKVYGISISPGMGYRNDHATGTALQGQPEGVYMVTSTLNLNARCCVDFGNAETNDLDNDAGHMDAINIKCQGQIPCAANAGLDMENGIYGHLKVPDGTEFVTDMGANDGQKSFAIYAASADAKALSTTGVLPLPPATSPCSSKAQSSSARAATTATGRQGISLKVS